MPDFVSVVSVNTTPDLRFCKVYVSFLDQGNAKEALAGLNSSAGYVRREIGLKIKLHYTPEITFVLDDSIRQGARINEIINNLNSKDDKR
ncbi:Ribosome-binding factor A [bioreactor metagenome]|uniref:Ribosome-binding factor A n=1 Tax=bioreactor metagenome TaxID=1076179 RepID=A0A645AUY5_9ZZZZ